LFVCQIYVDDIIFGSTNKYTCEEFSRIMIQKFEMSMMGELKYFLTPRGHLHQPNEVHSRHTHQVWDEGCQAHQDTHGNQWASRPRQGGKSVDQKVYRSMIGSLLYLCASRPDIAFRMHVCKIPSRS
jgi:hypothetical protein